MLNVAFETLGTTPIHLELTAACATIALARCQAGRVILPAARIHMNCHWLQGADDAAAACAAGGQGPRVANYNCQVAQ